VFAQTTHVVATRLYIPSFIEIRSGVSEPQGVKIWPFPLLWLVAFTTACTTVQAVITYFLIHLLVTYLLLPEQTPSVSRPQVVGGDHTWH